MTKIINVGFVLLFIILLVGCSKEEPIVEAPFYKITCLGDSRVEGGPFPMFESYRYYLWVKLIDGLVDFDFVGSRTDTKSYAEHNGLVFDSNHEGLLGDRTDQVLTRVEGLINSTPDAIGNVILLGVGGNDLYQGISGTDAAANISAIIDKLQGHNSSITIFIEQIEDGTTPFNSSGVIDPLELGVYNNAISSFVNAKSTATSKIFAVDMRSLLSDTDYADDLHYNASGAEKIANKYYEAMDLFLFQQ